MGNQIEYECKECTYWEAIHGINGFNYKDEKYKKCSHCTKRTALDYRRFIEKRGEKCGESKEA